MNISGNNFLSDKVELIVVDSIYSQDHAELPNAAVDMKDAEG